MKQILQDLGSGETSIEECPIPSMQENAVRIYSKVSLISAGTERMLVDFGNSSLLQKARKQPEKVKMVLDKLSTDGLKTTYEAVKTKISEPIPLGYSNVGVVEELSSEVGHLKKGDRVVSNGPHADIVVVNKNLCARIPDNVDDDSASFTVLGSIGLQGVRLANPTLGESFVVMGAGLIGLLTIQLLKANGCRVLAVDPDKKKLALAKIFGAEIYNPESSSHLEAIANEFSRGRGIDGVLITASTKSNDLIKSAANICRKRGRIVLVGVVGLDIDRSDFYDKEISFQVSCSYGPGRYDTSYEEQGIDYPIGFVRWTEQRNFEAFLDMLSMGKVDVKPLISNRYNFIDASSAYESLTQDMSSLGILLDYNTSYKERISSSLILEDLPKNKIDSPVLGIIGAGNYSSRILIPAFKKTGAQLHTLVSERGLSSKVIGRKNGFHKVSTNVEETLNNHAINTIVIATQHNTHAGYVSRALKANKNVWVEKPIAINLNELIEIENIFKEKDLTTDIRPHLMVGFNRRFSPHIVKMNALLSELDSPKSILITVNAGHIPENHWTQDPKIGGGRVIGEACHFIDLMRFLTSEKIISINTNAMFSKSTGKIITDRCSINLVFEDGSIGTILYLSNGSLSFPKERVEVFSEGKILQLDNFRSMKGFGWKNFKSMNLWSQDKGQGACTKAFIESLSNNEPCIPLNQIFEVAKASIEANELMLKQIS